jgi:hypothetical protein
VASDYLVGAVFCADGATWALVAANDGSVGGVVALDLATGEPVNGRLLPGGPGGNASGTRSSPWLTWRTDRLITIDTGAARYATPG